MGRSGAYGHGEYPLGSGKTAWALTGKADENWCFITFHHLIWGFSNHSAQDGHV
jgi:hypothetical protein